MTSDVREGVCFVVATSAPSLPRHDGDPAPVDGDGRARPALDLQEIGGFAVVPSHHVRVHVHRHARHLVAEPSLHALRVDAVADQEGGLRVSQLVEVEPT